MARGADDPTSSHQVVEQLQQVVQQLQAQTEELKQIRRASATTNKILAAGHTLLQQLLLLVNRISHACSSIATAVQHYLAAQQAAQQAALLHATLSSGRLLMLLAMAVLAVWNVRSAHSMQCMRSPASAWSAAVSTVGTWVLGTGSQQHKTVGMFAAMAAPARSGRCILAFAGRYFTGFALLVFWTMWARKQQQHRNISTITAPYYTMQQPMAASSSAAGASHAGPVTLAAPFDPIISLLLAVVPAGWGGSAGGIGHSSRHFAQLPGWVVVFQAALYEGCVGCLVLRLLSGRWWLWLLLWEGWLGWLCSRFLICDSTSTVAAVGKAQSTDLLAQTARANTQQLKGEQQVFWVDRLPVRVSSRSGNTADPAARTATTAGGRVAAGTASSYDQMAGGSSKGCVGDKSGRGSTTELLLRHAGLAMLQLGLPVVLAAGGLWL